MSACLPACPQLGDVATKLAPEADGPPPTTTTTNMATNSLKPLSRCSNSADLLVGQKVGGCLWGVCLVCLSLFLLLGAFGGCLLLGSMTQTPAGMHQADCDTTLQPRLICYYRYLLLTRGPLVDSLPPVLYCRCLP